MLKIIIQFYFYLYMYDNLPHYIMKQFYISSPRGLILLTMRIEFSFGSVFWSISDSHKKLVVLIVQYDLVWQQAFRQI